MAHSYIDRPRGHQPSFFDTGFGVMVNGSKAKRFFKRRDNHQKRRQAQVIVHEAIRDWINDFYWSVEDIIDYCGDDQYGQYHDDYDGYLLTEDKNSQEDYEYYDDDDWFESGYKVGYMPFKFVRIALIDLHDVAMIITNKDNDDLILHYVGIDHAILKLTDVQQAMIMQHDISFRYDWSHYYGS